jgi:hypothetical protein
MGRRFAIVIGVAAAGVMALGAQTAAAEAKTIKYTSEFKTSPVSTANGYPSPGGTAVLAGSLKLKPGGAGALVDRVTVTEQLAPNMFAFEGKEVDYTKVGTLRNKFNGTTTVQADGSQQLAIEGRFTGGTARYRGASGSFEGSATVAPGSDVIVGGSKGKIKY